MSVAEQTPVQGYTANGVTTAFSFPFTILAEGDLGVMVDGALQTLNVAYTVTGVGGASGTVTFTTAPANLAAIVIYRDSDLTRATDYQDNGDLLAATVNRDFDRLWLVLQEMLLGAKLSPRAVRAPVGETLSDLPAADVRKGKIQSFNISTGDVETVAPTEGTATALAILLAGTSSGQGASQIGAQDSANWFSAVATKAVETVLGWIGSWLWGRDYNVFQYLSTAEIASVKAYNYSVDVTANVQAAIDAAFAAQRGIFFPAGGYYCATGLKHPGRVSGGTDDRGKHFHMYGAGTGEAFVVSNLKGTVIKAGTVSAFSDYVDTAVSSNGSMELHHIRFTTTSADPVIYLQSMLGMQHIHDCVFHQLGTGDGIKVTLGPTCSIEKCYSMNSTWLAGTIGLGAARTGIGYNVATTWDGGLLNIRKCTSRGWNLGYAIVNDGGVPISYKLESCECSVTYSGAKLTGTNKAIIDSCYMEAGDGGIGIDVDGGSYASITNNLIFFGYSTGIKDTSTTNKGTVIRDNIINLGAVTPAIGIEVTSSAAFGGYNKVVEGNAIGSTFGTANVNGIKINGTDPRIQLSGNAFDGRGAWSGAGTLKINDTSSNGVYGIVQTQTGDREFLNLSRVALHWQVSSTVLTEANVSGNTLTLPDGCSYYTMTATVPVSINIIVGNVNLARELIIRTTNTNTTFTDSAFVALAGGASYNQVGILRGILDRSGANNLFYEMSRSSL